MNRGIRTCIKQTSNGWILTVIESAPRHTSRVAPYRYRIDHFLSSYQDAIALQHSYMANATSAVVQPLNDAQDQRTYIRTKTCSNA